MIWLRWIARILATLMAGLILVIFLGELMTEGIDRLSLRASLMMLAFFIIWSGYSVGWKLEMAGGLMILVGLAAFYLMDYAFSGTIPRGIIFPLMGLPGLLYLVSAIAGRRTGG